MKKGIIYLFCISLILSGCSIIPNNDQDPNVLADEDQKIIWWGMFEKEENIQPLIEDFESQNLGVEIEYTFWDDKNEYYTNLKDVLQDGNPNTTPDIFMISNTWVGNFESFITSAPSSTLSVDDMKNSFHNFVVEDFARNDVVRGVPLWVDLLALVYHKPYLLETGDTTISKNWNDFMTQAQNMTQYDENGLVERAGFSGGNSENVEFSFEMMNQLILQARSQPFDVESLGVPFNEDEKNAVSEAMDFYRTFSSTNNKTWDSNFKLDTAEFIEGDLASIVIPSWRILDIEAYDKDRNLNLDIEVAKVPQLNPDTLEPVYYPTYWGYVVSKESSKSSISWEFLKFITDRNQQEKYIQHQLDNGRLFPMISPRKDLLNISREYEYLVPYVDSIEKTHSWYMINGEKLEPVYDEVLNSSKSIDEIMITFESLDNDKNVI